MKLVAYIVLALHLLTVIHAAHEHFDAPTADHGDAVLHAGTDCPDPAGETTPCSPSCSCSCCHPPVALRSVDAHFVPNLYSSTWELALGDASPYTRRLLRPPEPRV